MVSDHQRARQPQPHGHRNTMTNSPLVSTSFITSWRGQVLICTVCLAFGAVYFFVRRAVTPIIQRRREAISEARQAELMSSEEATKKKESIEAPTSVEKSGSKDVKGKDKRKDVKKRKASSTLKVNVVQSGSEDGQQMLGGASTAGSGHSQAGPSSRESSPAARHLTLPTPKSKSLRKQPVDLTTQPIELKPRDRSISVSNWSYSPSPSPSPSSTPLIRIRQPTAEEAVRSPASLAVTSTRVSKAVSADIDQDMTSDRQTEKDAKPPRNISESVSDIVTGQRDMSQTNVMISNPELIPLPPSPMIEAGPPRSSGNHDYDPGNESDSTSTHSVSSTSNLISGPTTNTSFKSRLNLPAVSPDGFSIMPDARYLPPSITSSTTHKRKKKKDRSPDLFDDNHSFNRSHSHQSNQTRLSSSTNTTSLNNNQSSDNLSRYSQPTSVDTESNTPNSPSAIHSKPPLDTPLILRPSARGHSRKPSLKSIRPPPNPTAEQLEEYCIERDQLVENLRAELGSAKAQEAKAKEAALKTRLELERTQDELEHLNKQSATAKAEHTRVATQLVQDYLEVYKDMMDFHTIAFEFYRGPVGPQVQGHDNNGMMPPPMRNMHASVEQFFGVMDINPNGAPHMVGPPPHVMHGMGPRPFPGMPPPPSHPPFGMETPNTTMGISPPSSMPTGMGPQTPGHRLWQSGGPPPSPYGPQSPGPYQNGFTQMHGFNNPHQVFQGHPPMPSPFAHSPHPQQWGQQTQPNGFVPQGPPMNPSPYVGPLSPMNMSPIPLGPGSKLLYMVPPQDAGPNPGMQQNQPGMLHPNQAFMNGTPNGQMPYPNGQRRISIGPTPTDVFAGPLTPGIPQHSGAPPVPSPMGLGLPSDIEAQRMQPGTPADMSAERRVSIQDSVMRKKPVHGNEGAEPMQPVNSNENAESPNPDLSLTLVQTPEAEKLKDNQALEVQKVEEPKVNHGLGVGLVEDAEPASRTPSPASSRSRKFKLSPSPELHRALSRESGTPISAPSSPTLSSRESVVSDKSGLDGMLIQEVHDKIEAREHVVIDDLRPRKLSTSISDGLLRPRSKSPSLNGDAQQSDPAKKNGNGPIESHSPSQWIPSPYYPSMAWSREENEERRAKHDAEQEIERKAWEKEQMEKKTKALASQNVTIQA